MRLEAGQGKPSPYLPVVPVPGMDADPLATWPLS